MSEEKRCEVCGHVLDLTILADGKFEWRCLCGATKPAEEKDLPPDAYRKRHGEV